MNNGGTHFGAVLSGEPPAWKRGDWIVWRRTWPGAYGFPAVERVPGLVLGGAIRRGRVRLLVPGWQSPNAGELLRRHVPASRALLVRHVPGEYLERRTEPHELVPTIEEVDAQGLEAQAERG